MCRSFLRDAVSSRSMGQPDVTKINGFRDLPRLHPSALHLHRSTGFFVTWGCISSSSSLKESRRIGDELSFREAKPEPGQVMELELPHRFHMFARISGFPGFKDWQKCTQEALDKQNSPPYCGTGRGLRGFHLHRTLRRLHTR